VGLFDECVNVDNVIRQHCFSLRDELRFGVHERLDNFTW